MRRKTWECFFFISCVMPTALCFADDRQEGERHQDCVGHRDHGFSGDSLEVVGSVARIVAGATSMPAASTRIAAELGKEPFETFVTSGFLRGTWLLEASRLSERIDCSGEVEKRFEWDFAIVEAQWSGESLPTCVVYRKHEFGAGTRPDPFRTTSSLDTTQSCAAFLATSTKSLLPSR
jgi:hypothetical protein